LQRQIQALNAALVSKLGYVNLTFVPQSTGIAGGRINVGGSTIDFTLGVNASGQLLFNNNPVAEMQGQSPIERIAGFLDQTDTRYVNTHLAPRAEDFPGLTVETRDPACAGLLAAISVLGGLAARALTGRGQRTEVNLYDTGLLMLANVAANYLATGTPSGRFGNSHPNIVPYRNFRASDGEVAVGVGNDDQFVRLAAVLGYPEWVVDPRFAANRDRVANRSTIDTLIQGVIGTASRAHWVEALNEVGVPAGPINDVAEALTSEQARGMVTEVDHPLAGMIRLLGLPILFEGTPAAITRHPPLLGEHTVEVLTEFLRMTPFEVEALQAAGVV